MSKISFSIDILSPPHRSVLMTAKHIGLDIDLKQISIFGIESLSEEALMKHAIPTLVDGDIKVRESHSIMIYLAEKYDNVKNLYPKDHDIRAKIHTIMFFESAVMSSRIKVVFDLIRDKNIKNILPERIQFFLKGLQYLENAMTSEYMVGDHVTLADLSLITTVASFLEVLEQDMAQFPKVKAWIERMQKLSYYDDVNQDGFTKMKEMLKVITGN